MPSKSARKGRPPTDQPARNFCRTRITDQEFSWLNDQARGRSITVSRLLRAYVTSHMNKQPLAAPRNDGLTKDAIHHLARIGNNLNQLSHQNHAGYTPAEFRHIHSAIDALNGLIDKLRPV